jgi:hypothetical protein
MMTEDEIEAALGDADLIPFFQGPLPDAKEMRDACLAARIPAVLDRGACCGSGGCGCAPKLQLLIRRDDFERAAHLAASRWRELAVREGTLDDQHPLVAAARADADELRCPACASAAPLVAGACADCGLQLE